nr:hypothetical protein Iba_chr06bCG15510 [Ipomoea batatas]
MGSSAKQRLRKVKNLFRLWDAQPTSSLGASFPFERWATGFPWYWSSGLSPSTPCGHRANQFLVRKNGSVNGMRQLWRSCIVGCRRYIDWYGESIDSFFKSWKNERNSAKAAQLNSLLLDDMPSLYLKRTRLRADLSRVKCGSLGLQAYGRRNWDSGLGMWLGLTNPLFSFYSRKMLSALFANRA